MDEKNIDIRGQFPKSLIHLPPAGFRPDREHERPRIARAVPTPVRVWKVPDPIFHGLREAL